MELDQKRVAWVDYAKGFCIVMVVMMHSTQTAPGQSDQSGLGDSCCWRGCCWRRRWSISVSRRCPASSSASLSSALAVVTLSALLSTRNRAHPLRYAGQNSIIVYLAFFLPMAATRTVLLRFTPVLDLGVICLIVTGVAVIVPLAFYPLRRERPIGARRASWPRNRFPIGDPSFGFHASLPA
jgi:fucose 4-O-acetylase-like acetyltransferase